MSSESPHVVGRVAALLRVVGDVEPDGGTTSDLARRADLARPTTHRLLTSMLAEGLVDRDMTSGRWTLGPELYLLGAAAAARYDITDTAADLLEHLARETGESAFLSARRGDQTVCLRQEDGSFPLRSHVLSEGIRFPLGVASAGLVILAHLPAGEVDDYLGRQDLTTQWGPHHSASALRRRLTSTRSAGYAVNPGLVVPGSWGMGAAVFDPQGAPRWALSLTGVEARFSAERQPRLGRLLLDHAHLLTQRVAGRRTG